jgi:hypothetical protein
VLLKETSILRLGDKKRKGWGEEKERKRERKRRKPERHNLHNIAPNICKESEEIFV